MALAGAHNEKKKERGEKYDTTTLLIKIQVFTCTNMLLNLARMDFLRTAAIYNPRAPGAFMILLLAAVLQRHLLRQLKQSGKRLITLTDSPKTVRAWLTLPDLTAVHIGLLYLLKLNSWRDMI